MTFKVLKPLRGYIILRSMLQLTGDKTAATPPAVPIISSQHVNPPYKTHDLKSPISPFYTS